MNFGRSAREQAQFLKFRYPGTDVLVNKLGIMDAERLGVAERQFVENRMKQGLPEEARELSYGGFKAIHRRLFQDIYEWAGSERTYTTGRAEAPFAIPQQITPWLEKRFALLRSEKFLSGLKPQAFAWRAAEHVNEINAAHPFIEGNGRTQRTWLRYLAERAGYTLTLSSRDRHGWYEASRVGFEQQDHAPMSKLILDNLVERNRDRGE